MIHSSGSADERSTSKPVPPVTPSAPNEETTGSPSRKLQVRLCFQGSFGTFFKMPALTTCANPWCGSGQFPVFALYVSSARSPLWMSSRAVFCIALPNSRIA